MTAPQATVGAGRRQLVTFEAAGELFAADISAVERVLRYTSPRLLPNSSAWLKGVIDHGGAAIPVVDLRERLGLTGWMPAENARILVLAVDGLRIGLVVDVVHAVRTVEAQAIEPPPAVYRGLTREYLEGVARQGGELFVVLAAGKLLTSTERIEMERVTGAERGDG